MRCWRDPTLHTNAFCYRGWACLLTEAERAVPSVAEYVAAVVATASAIASAQLATALGL